MSIKKNEVSVVDNSMKLEVIDSGKDFIELKINNPTIAELLRVYLNKEGIKFAAWRREHPSKPVVFRVEVASGTVKKAVADAVKDISKDCAKIISALK